MAKLVLGMNQSLDGYVDHMRFAPGPTLFRHFIEEAEQQAGSVHGRRICEPMRCCDDEHPGRAFPPPARPSWNIGVATVFYGRGAPSTLPAPTVAGGQEPPSNERTSHGDSQEHDLRLVRS
jgi:hypothetical protein